MKYESKITDNPGKTRERIAALEAYCRDNVHDGCAMTCPHAVTCRNSVDHFYGGQLSHVGKSYDLEIDGNPCRIVIVGQEYGRGDELVTLAQRAEMISGRSAGVGFSGRNPHMKGTTSTLRLLMGREPGEDVAGETLADGHIFDGFALVNALLCSATDTPRAANYDRGAGRGRSSWVMQRNCASHFMKTLEILDPTVIVLQGAGVRKWVGGDLGIGSSGSVVETCSINDHDVKVLTFYHPSAHHPYGYRSLTAPYLIEVIAPTIRALERA